MGMCNCNGSCKTSGSCGGAGPGYQGLNQPMVVPINTAAPPNQNWYYQPYGYWPPPPCGGCCRCRGYQYPYWTTPYQPFISHYGQLQAGDVGPQETGHSIMGTYGPLEMKDGNFTSNSQGTFLHTTSVIQVDPDNLQFQQYVNNKE